MECAKFEELGLMYATGELDAAAAAEYEAHLSGCDYCKREVGLYKEERASLFTADMLGEPPPPSVDAEILRVCDAPQKTRVLAFFPMMFIKKYAPIPIFLMLLTVAIIGYIGYSEKRVESIQAKNPAAIKSETPGDPDIVNLDEPDDAHDHYGDAIDTNTTDIDSVRQQRRGRAGVPVSGGGN